MTDLTLLWKQNRDWRRWMDANTKFVTPDTLDCLRYALCESCEALDAWMRSRLPDHARNNGRDHTVESELADTAMLLLTAMPVEYANDALITSEDLDTLFRTITNAIYWYKIPVKSQASLWRASARRALCYIAHYPGLDLPAELDRCWRRLAVKHGWGALYRWCLENQVDSTLIPPPSGEQHSTNQWPTPWLVEEPTI